MEKNEKTMLEKRKKRLNFALKKRTTMITRKLDAFLDEFYRTQNKALLLTGARQVGKTEAFRRLAARTYEHFIEINFIKTPRAMASLTECRAQAIFC